MTLRTELLGRLQAMEEAYAPYRFVVDGAPIWPILRVEAGTTALRESLMEFKAPSPLRFHERLTAMTNAIRQWYALPGTKASGPLLFQSRRAYQAITPQGTLDKFAHPLMVAASSLGKESILLQYEPMPDPTFPQLAGITIRRIDAWNRARSWYHSKHRTPKWIGNEQELEALIGELVNLAGTDGMVNLERAVNNFRMHLGNSRALLQRISPRHVFITCWYKSENMAMSHACYERGIPCTDLQHGVQGPAHLAYGAWHGIPDAGCSTIPSSFWCWDEASANNIRSWAPENNHLAFVGGAPWLEERASTVPTEARSILYSLQPLKEMIPKDLGQAIKNDGTDLNWVFRLHPNGLHMAEYIHQWALDEGIDQRVRIEHPGTRPLSRSLQDAIIHITLFSSVIREAALLGVSSIALHPEATTIFPDLANGPYLSFVSDLRMLPQRIASVRTRTRSSPQLPPLPERLGRLFDLVSTEH